MKNKLEHGLVIIGNGISGITTARHVRKLYPKLRIRIISEESNYFYSRTALMYIYMGHMSFQDTQPYAPQFYRKNRLELVSATVDSIDVTQKKIKLSPPKNNLNRADTLAISESSSHKKFHNNTNEIQYDMLLLATGSQYRMPGVSGDGLEGVQGMYSLQDLQKLESYGRKRKIERAVIVGGGLIGIELAEMLHVRGVAITFLVRENTYWGNILPREESQMINAEIRRHHIDLHLSTQLKEITSNDQGQVTGVVCENGDKIDCQFVGLCIGVTPNLKLVKNTKVEAQKGILIDPKNMQSNIPGIFAAGDCAQLRNPDGSGGQVEQLWYTGRMQGEVAAHSIATYAYEQAGEIKKAKELRASHSPYDRGIWFNSAKFFTIEYQTYGKIFPSDAEKGTFVWQDSKKCQFLRLCWSGDTPDSPLIGMNCLGTRYRHKLFEKWLQEGRSALYAIQHLHEAAFDAEFSKATASAFQTAYAKKTA